jgi:hypothetical protein
MYQWAELQPIVIERRIVTGRLQAEQSPQFLFRSGIETEF